MINQLSRTKTLILNNSVNKVASLVIAFFLWSQLSDMYLIETHYTVPVIVQAPSRTIEKAPESAVITVRGLRKNMRRLDPATLAIRIQEQELKEPAQVLQLRNEHLGLPASLTLASYSPLNFMIESSKKVENTAV